MSSGSSSLWVYPIVPKGSPPDTLAQICNKVPKMKSVHGDTLENNRRDRARKSIIKVLNWMMWTPMQAEAVWSSIDSNTVVEKDAQASSAATTSTQQNAQMESSIKTTFGKTDDKVKTAVYTKLLGEDAKVLDLVNDQDPFAISDMFRSNFQLENFDKVPQLAQDDFNVFVHMCKLRGEEVGSRWKAFFRDSVNKDGAVAWEKAPLFRLKYDEQRCLEEVVHVSGAVGRPPSHVRIPDTWVLLEPCSDFEARFELASNEIHYIRGMFEDGVGPNEFRCDKAGRHMATLALQAQQSITDAVQQVAAITDSPTCLDLSTRNTRLRRESLAKARAARQANPLSAKKRRVASRALAIADVAPAPAAVAAEEEADDGN